MIGIEARRLVGRVLRASTVGFDCGTRGSHLDEELHTFGAYVRTPIGDQPGAYALGLIYAIRIDDDPLARELVMASFVDNNALIDQRENRMVPIEIGVVNVGFMYEGILMQSLPPRPPMSLAQVELCSADEVYQFTQRCDFFRLVINAKEVPSDELIAAAIRYASWAYPENERYDFSVRCGRHLARLLSHDLKRLSHVLELIKPSAADRLFMPASSNGSGRSNGSSGSGR
ncbi:MAG: hypothetical protein SGJ24_06960 [Chloroflexota bacterium]|nr:hypothetical protein [Chloroflexota bacterium]